MRRQVEGLVDLHSTHISQQPTSPQYKPGSPSLVEPATALDPSKQYALRRDYSAAVRLNSQFWLWKNELGFNIHPTITPLFSSLSVTPTQSLAHSSSSSPIAIADLGTGTGIWLLDQARAHPGVQFDGFDIDLGPCPPAAWLPKNVMLQQWDIFADEIPSELVGKYDVVHCRLLLLVVAQNNPGRLLRNMRAMLKPGGWMQWDELDVFGAFVASAEEGSNDASGQTETKATFQRKQELADFSGLEWVANLTDIIADSGFTGVAEHVYQPDLAMAKFFQDTHLMMMEEAAIVAKATPKKSAAIYDAIGYVEDARKPGLAFCTPKKVIIAQKPMPEF